MDQRPIFIFLMLEIVAKGYSVACAKLWIGINPALREINYEPFCFLSGFETVRQSVDGVRVTSAIDLPSDFRARSPEFAALLQSGIGDDEPVVIEQVCHADDLSIRG
jgi:hypothetical protein